MRKEAESRKMLESLEEPGRSLSLDFKDESCLEAKSFKKEHLHKMMVFLSEHIKVTTRFYTWTVINCDATWWTGWRNKCLFWRLIINHLFNSFTFIIYRLKKSLCTFTVQFKQKSRFSSYGWRRWELLFCRIISKLQSLHPHTV